MQSEKLEFDCAVRSVIGTRAEQQDAVAFYDDGVFVAVVCDGMGGMTGGKLASTTAASTLINMVKNKDENVHISDLYQECVGIMDQKVYALKKSNGEPLRAGTTVVSICIDEDKLYWMNVGDSRLYMVRGNEIVQVTRDHNYFLSLESMPEYYTPNEEDIKKGNALISFIGMGGVKIADISKNAINIMPGDYILMTSDGLSKSVTDDEILSVLLSSNGVTDACERLLACSEKNAPKARDNTTFVLMKAKKETI